LARCSLDLNHPKFKIIGNASDADLQAGLNELRDKVADNHSISGFFNQPMPKYPLYQNKLWKWDFAPQGDTSSTRKGWRLYAFVPDAKAPEPIAAVAFLCYDRGNAPRGDYVKYLVGILKKFLAQTVTVEAVEDKFKRQTDQEGQTISLCYTCWATICISADIGEIEVAEQTHECPNSN
jgi:hypothetical protein